MLGLLEKKGHIQSAWNMDCERPKKVYKLTEQGKNVLNYAEKSLVMIQQKLTLETETEIMANPEALKQNHVRS